MQYDISIKNVKQSVSNLGKYLKEKGHTVSHSVLLEAFAKSLYFKNYNTIEALARTCRIVEHIKPAKRYHLEIEVDLSSSTVKNIVYDSFKQAKSTASIVQFRSSSFNNTCQYYVEIDVTGLSTNTLTALFLLSDSFKKIGAIPTRMEYARVFIEKESLMEFFK